MKKDELVDKIFELRSDWTEEDMTNNGYKHSGDMVTKLFKCNELQLHEIMKEELDRLYKNNLWEK